MLREKLRRAFRLGKGRKACSEEAEGESGGELWASGHEVHVQQRRGGGRKLRSGLAVSGNR